MKKKKSSNSALWGMRAVFIAAIVIILCVVGVAMSNEKEDTNRRLGGPMYGIDVVADGDTKFIVYGKRTDLIYENNGDEYEIEKYFVDFETKRVWLAIDRFDAEDNLEQENMYSADREMADSEIDEIKDVFNDIMNHPEKYNEPVEGERPYTLSAGEKQYEIYEKETINQLTTVFGL